MDICAKKFLFNNVAVKAFGMPEYNSEISEQIEILEYENDNKFILRILPKDNNDEIILAKGLNANTTFESVFRKIEEYRDQRINDTITDDNIWKISIKQDDAILIPELQFNYISNYNSIVGQQILVEDHKLRIDAVSQRNAFLLNEHGAKVESQADLAVAAAAAPANLPPVKKEHPKKLYLNKEFVVVLKKHTAQDPYFMAVVRNIGIMTRLDLSK